MAGVDARTLYADEDKDRDQHGRADLGKETGLGHARAAPEIGAE